MCSGGNLPEVEIISLLEEQIPQYTLRADTLTQFTGKFQYFLVIYRNSYNKDPKYLVQFS